jgi:ABC-2 type transport system permease protein
MGSFIRRYLALATKEFQQLRRNPGLIVQLLIPPTIVLIIFGYALNPRVRDLRLGVVDQNQTVESRNFIDALTQNINFNVTRVYSDTGDATDALRSLKLDLFLVIPHDFDRTEARGEMSRVQVVIDAVDANTAQIAQGYLQQAMDEYNISNGEGPVGAFHPSRTIIRAAHPAPPPGAVEVRPA